MTSIFRNPFFKILAGLLIVFSIVLMPFKIDYFYLAVGYLIFILIAVKI